MSKYTQIGKLLDDIIYVARSLGFAAYKKECKKSCMYKGEKRMGTYYRTTIHGEGLEEIKTRQHGIIDHIVTTASEDSKDDE